MSPEMETAMQDQPEMAAAQEEVSDMQVQLEALNDELANARDQLMRAQADVQNIRRRAEQDVEKAHKYGQEKLVSDLLPVVDNLERALAAITADDEVLKSLVEGVELTLRSFQDTLQKHSIVALDPHGEPFDPQVHQAMAMVDAPDAEPNTVVNVFQKGYTLHGRLVRPAMVVVSKTN
jgi:molecular chaperone GrpE